MLLRVLLVAAVAALTPVSVAAAPAPPPQPPPNAALPWAAPLGTSCAQGDTKGESINKVGGVPLVM